VIFMKRFLDFDTDNNILYDNIYVDEFKIVVKIPIKKRKNSQEEIKIEKFDLTRYLYLVHYN